MEALGQEPIAYLELCRRGQAAAVVRRNDMNKVTMEIGVINQTSNEDLAALAPDPAELRGRGVSIAILKKKYVSNLNTLYKSLKRTDSHESVDPLPNEENDTPAAPGIRLHPDFYECYIKEVSMLHAKVERVFEYGFREAELVHFEDLQTPFVA